MKLSYLAGVLRVEQSASMCRTRTGKGIKTNKQREMNQ